MTDSSERAARFEYTILSWSSNVDGTDATTALNEMGSDGWEAVGLTAAARSVPMPGMGAHPEHDVIVLLKRSIV